MTEEYKVPDGMVGFSKLSGHSVAVQYCEGFYQMLFLQILSLLFFFLQVIGRGGEQISRIQQESGCKIQIAPGNYSCFLFLFCWLLW